MKYGSETDALAQLTSLWSSATSLSAIEVYVDDLRSGGEARRRGAAPALLLQEEMQKLARVTSHRPSVSMGELRGSISAVGKSLEGAEATDRYSADDVNRALALL